MSRITPNMRDLAQRVIHYEAARRGTTGAGTPASFPVCAKLRPQLATLMGSTGFRVLLSRALQMARDTQDSLRLLQVNTEGALEWIVGSQAATHPPHMDHGSVELVARLLTLLAAFIGEDLTFRIVQDVWLKLPPATSVIDKGKSK